MVSGFFDGSDEFSFLTSEPCAFANREAAFKEVINLLGGPDKNVSPEADIGSPLRAASFARARPAVQTDAVRGNAHRYVND